MEIKAISLWQPWASLIALGYKQYETRSWSTHYRGRILICSALKNTPFLRSVADDLVNQHQLSHCYQDWSQYPLGKAVAIGDLTECIPITSNLIAQQSQLELDCGNWQLERYAWKLENIKPIIPFPLKRQQKLFTITYNSDVFGNHASATVEVKV